MEVQKDFRDLFELLNAHKVEYMIVGAYALAFYGAPRYTGDMDIFVKPDPGNAQHIMAALNDFGFGSAELSATDFETEDRVVQLGFPPVRIDLVTSQPAFRGKKLFRTDRSSVWNIPVYYIGRQQFISIGEPWGGRRSQTWKPLAKSEPL
jgi:hypothetical protein